jgi:hypothetical protein
LEVDVCIEKWERSDREGRKSLEFWYGVEMGGEIGGMCLGNCGVVEREGFGILSEGLGKWIGEGVVWGIGWGMGDFGGERLSQTSVFVNGRSKYGGEKL